MAFNSISTVHQGVAAETRHQVDLLHDTVNNLHEKINVLPKLIGSFESSVDEQIGRMIKIIHVFQTHGDSFTDAKVNKVFHDIEVKSAKTQSEFDERYRKASHDSIKAMEEGARTTLHHDISKPISRFIEKQNNNVWKTYGICFACALLAALFSSWMSIHFQTTKEEKDQMLWGVHVLKVWDKIDKKTQALLQNGE